MNWSNFRRSIPLGILAFFLTNCRTVHQPVAASDPSTPDALNAAAMQPSAGSPSPTSNGGQIRGIDISHNVGAVNWPDIRSDGITFAFIKASDGVSYSRVDYFYENWPKMQAAGIVRGAYHFYESADDPVAQADYFADVLQKAGGLGKYDLPPALDFEHATSGANVMKFLQRIKQRTGRNPIIYVDEDFANTCLNDPAFASFPLWITEYGVAAPKVPSTWKGAAKSWTIWQSAENGTVAGIPGGSGATDLNLFNGSGADFKNFISGSYAGR